jgi:vitamin B12 transporter
MVVSPDTGQQGGFCPAFSLSLERAAVDARLGQYVPMLSGRTVGLLRFVSIIMKNRFTKSACAHAVALCLSASTLSSLYAQAQNSASQSTPTQLEDITVTATRTPTRSDALVSDVRSFDREEIEAAKGESLPEFLQRRANLQIAGNGGAGQITNVYMRGTNSNHTLVLVDGVRYGSVSDGAPGWANLPLSAIARIEVLKGPASSLYGSDALGGVVQIFTHQDRIGFYPSLSFTAGSKKTHEVKAGFNGGTSDVKYAFGISDKREGTHSTTTERSSNFQPDIDRFRQESVHGSLSWKVATDWRMGASFAQADGIVHYDDGKDSSGQYLDTRNSLTTESRQVFVEGKVLPIWKTKLSLGQSVDGYQEIESKYAAYGTSHFNTTQTQTTWQNDIAVPVLGNLIVGFEKSKQSLDASTDYTTKARNTDSVFAGLQGKHQRLNWQLNARRDKNSQFGSANTGSVGLGYQVTPSLRLRGSHGTSFVAPSFNNLYYPPSCFAGSCSVYNNPNLQPEKGKNSELGLEWVYGNHEVQAGVFQNRVSNLVTYLKQGSSSIPQNTAKASMKGWSLGYKGTVGDFSLRADYEHLTTKDESTGLELLRRAKAQWTLGVDYKRDKWSVGVDVLGAGSRADKYYDSKTFKSVDTRLDAYRTLGLNASYEITKDWSLAAKVTNLTDKSYETVYGYQQPGRAVSVTLRFQPK